MFELPEMMTFASQINQNLQGRNVQQGELGNSPHKFVWYNRSPDEFQELVTGKQVGKAHARGRWLFVPLEPGYVMVIGECGGKLLLHPPDGKLPKKYHLHLIFDDGSFLTATTQMWGAYELYKKGEELEREIIRDMRPIPLEPAFTRPYFFELIDEVLSEGKRSVKGLLTQDQLIPGLGNSIAQDIMFRSQLHPKLSLGDLSEVQKNTLYQEIQDTVSDVIEKGGRYDEFDLFGNPGGYRRLMDKNALNHPCPTCDGEIQKIQYLGGACYLCPKCQPS